MGGWVGGWKGTYLHPHQGVPSSVKGKADLTEWVGGWVVDLCMRVFIQTRLSSFLTHPTPYLQQRVRTAFVSSTQPNPTHPTFSFPNDAARED